jgi:hypothetical protein
MARPGTTPIQSSQQAWDATTNDNFDVLTLAPLPVVEFANLAALPPANSYDRCIAALTDGSLWISDGSAGVPVNGGGSPNGGTSQIVSVETLLDASVSLTWAGAFPAGAVAIGVSGLVVSALVSVDGATHVTVGDGSDADLHDANLGLASGQVFSQADATADPTGWSAAARNVVVAPVAGTLVSGTVRLTAHYMVTSPPVS